MPGSPVDSGSTDNVSTNVSTAMHVAAVLALLAALGTGITTVVMVGRATRDPANEVCCRVPTHTCMRWSRSLAGRGMQSDNVCGTCMGVTCTVSRGRPMCSGGHAAFPMAAFVETIAVLGLLVPALLLATSSGATYPRILCAAVILGVVAAAIALGIVGAAENDRISFSNHSEVYRNDGQESAIEAALPYLTCEGVAISDSPAVNESIVAEQFVRLRTHGSLVPCILTLGFAMAAVPALACAIRRDLELKFNPWRATNAEPVADTEDLPEIVLPPIAVPPFLLQDETDAPPEFVCPLTHFVMDDPVLTADGNTYQRSAIAEWFRQGHLRSPLTNLPLAHRRLVPNMELRAAITAASPPMTILPHPTLA